jgi:SAM-dependent methyltransferase
MARGVTETGRDDASANARHWEQSAQHWLDTADDRYPARAAFWPLFADELRTAFVRPPRVLELGAGPGMLAERLLGAVPVETYALVDVSPAMHALARARLAPHAARTRFITADYGASDWTQGLGSYDALVSLQAIHEVRRKERVPAVYRAARAHLTQGAVALICDRCLSAEHPGDETLHMTAPEHERALREGGFEEVRLLARAGELAMFRAA